MINRIFVGCLSIIALSFAACNRSKPKPISNDITRMTVPVAGKTDSVINNSQKNYGNATVSEPCIKCLIGVIQETNDYRLITSGIAQRNIVYDVNWITSSKPLNIDSDDKIINGMIFGIILKEAGSRKRLISYLYNNKNGQLYLRNDQNNDIATEKIDSESLEKIRNGCFWGVASAK